MTRARYLGQRLLRMRSASARAQVYERVEAQYGEGFASALRDDIESHHLIVANERKARRAQFKPKKEKIRGHL